MKPVALLLAICAVPPGLFAVLAGLDLVYGPWQIPAIATAVAVLPAALTLGLLACLRHRPPAEVIGLLLVGTFVRMGLAFAGGFIAYAAFPIVREKPLPAAAWALAMYLVSLGLELAFGYRLLQAGPPARPTGSGSP